MAKLLTNVADVVGEFDGISVDNSTTLSVQLTTLEIEKLADKEIWIRDELEYTIIITNIDDSDPPIPAEDVVVTDVIEPTIATLVAGSVNIDGQSAPSTDYDFDVTTGLLTVRLGTVNNGTPRRITFRVEFVTP